MGLDTRLRRYSTNDNAERRTPMTTMNTRLPLPPPAPCVATPPHLLPSLAWTGPSTRSPPRWLLAGDMPVVAAMTVWTWLFDWQRGVVNWLLSAAGLPFQQPNWLQNPLSFFAVAGIIVVWMSVPFVAFSLFAGLTQVPDEVLEA